MNINFKIAWFEDTSGWYKATAREIEEYIREKNFIPMCDRYLSDKFDISEFEYSNYDLILMDFKLSYGATGDTIIKKIRDNKIVTDIVFYSSEYADMKARVTDQGELLDGVYYSDRRGDLFNSKVLAVINKLIRKSEDVVNLRGIMMDNTSEFDECMKEILEITWSKGTDEDKRKLTKKAKEILRSSKKGYDKDYEQFLKEDTNLIEILGSKGYYFDAYKKARLINHVIEILNNKTDVKFKNDFAKFNEQYTKNIIDIRNQLGHVRQSSDTSTPKYIRLNEEESVVLDEELCNKIRKDILKYRNMFEELLDIISRLKDEA